MSVYTRIKELADTHAVSIRGLEEKLGFPSNTIGRWDTNTPSVERVSKVADYFDVSIDYLMGRTEKPNLYTYNNQVFTMEEALDSIMSYDGKELTDNDRLMMKNIFKTYIQTKE